MKLLKQGIKDRYVVINEKKDIVTYLPQGKDRKYSNPEEKVQLETFLDLIYNYDYPAEKLRVCEKVKIGSSTREADIVVYRDRECKDPLVIVECKKRSVSNSIFTEAIDQGFSYVAVTNAEYVWATSGDKNAHFEVMHDAIHEREINKIDRIPKHKEEARFGYNLKRRIRSALRRPVFSDTMLFSTVLVLCTLVLSKMAVEFHSNIFQATKFLWEKHGMDFNWIFNAIALTATLVSMIFGMIFMRSHNFFRASKIKRRITLSIIALILFVPVWYVGESMSDPNWWTWSNFQARKHPIVIYLWPYVKSMPIQFLAIYAMIWLMGRGKNKA